MCVCVRACVRACVRVFVARHISETNEAIAIKCDKVTAFILNYGHTSMFCKALVSAFVPSALSVSRRVNDARHSKNNVVSQ